MMSWIEVVIIAIGLSLDAFAVSIGSAANGKIDDKRSAVRLAFHFGLFQGFMPIIGWFIGDGLERLLEDVDHWIAFILLAYVGIKMILEAFDDKEDEKRTNPSKGKTLVILSLATSIDALIVGFSLGLLKLTIWYPSLIIGVITASMSLIGIYLGKMFGKKFGMKMELLGGCIIIGIGLKILFADIL
ncbi:MAG: manganese efflux pump MntP family protein [bacterium]